MQPTNQSNRKGFIILGTIILIIAGVAFYWFGYRPEKIRKDCYAKAWRYIYNIQESQGFPAKDNQAWVNNE